MRIGQVFKNKKRLVIMAAIIGLSLIAASVPSFPGFTAESATAQAATVSKAILAKNTLYHDTPLYVVKSGKPGPVVMIVGGSHGNCTSGILAAEKIKDFDITAGTLLVIPRANMVAVKNGTRTSSGVGDLNRTFPRTKNGKADSLTAQSIWDVVKDYDVDYLIDMHEGDDYHKINPSSTGQTLIYQPISGSQAVGQEIIDAINNTIGSSNKHFSLMRYPYPGTLARAASEFLGVKAFTLETCRKSAESIRVDDEVLAARTLLSHLDMMASEATVTRVTLAQNTANHKTPMYVIDSGKPGPNVMIVGGVHGNETSGPLAADEIKNLRPEKGTLLVLPRANIAACESGTRTSSIGDLNRDFPRTKNGKAGSKTAQSIWDTITKYDVDYLIDLHEGYNYHKIKPSSYGQTLLYYPISGSRTVGLEIINDLNKGIGSSSKYFTLVKYPYEGTLARAAAQHLGVKAFTMETCRISARSIRVDNGIKATKTLLRYLDMY